MLSFIATTFAQKESIDLKTEKREVSTFNSLDISGRFVVEIYYSEIPEISITAAEKYIHTIETKVENGMLQVNMLDAIGEENISLIDGVRMKYKDYLIRKPIEVKIGVNKLSIINLAGLSNLRMDKVMQVDDLYVSMGDGAKASLRIHSTDKVDITLTGRSKLDIDGHANQFILNVHGASSVVGSNFKVKDLTINQTGASRAETYATESLDATLVGATKLSCWGSPKSIKQKVAMGSSIDIQ